MPVNRIKKSLKYTIFGKKYSIIKFLYVSMPCFNFDEILIINPSKIFERKLTLRKKIITKIRNESFVKIVFPRLFDDSKNLVKRVPLSAPSTLTLCIEMGRKRKKKKKN